MLGVVSPEIEEVRSRDFLARELATRCSDSSNAPSRRIHPPHSDPQKVLATVPRLSRKVCGLDPSRFQERFELGRHEGIQHRSYAGIGVNSATLGGPFRRESLMTKTAKNPFPFADTIGPQIKERKRQRGLSDIKFAQRADVSRRHLVELQKGSNVTLLVLLKAMEALGIEEINLRGGATRKVTLPVPSVDTPAILTAAEKLESGAALILHVAEILRAAAKGAEPIERQSKKGRDLAAKAANLIEDFGGYVRTLDTEEQVDALQRLVDVTRSDVSRQSQRHPRKRRTTA